MNLYINDAGLSDTEKDKPSENEIKHCEAWIKRFARPSKAINQRAFSYSLKHVVEKWHYNGTTWHDPGGYVSNGAFIQAAVNLCYRYKRDGSGPNAFFNMKFKKNRDWYDWQNPYLPWSDES